MKLFLSRIFCLFLALQVLLSSAGFAMNEHYCKIKGEKVWSLSKALSCCSVKDKQQFQTKTPSFKKTKCCNDKVFHAKVTTESNQNTYTDSVDYASLVWECQMPPMWAFRNEVLPVETASILYYHSPAPPPSGRDILIKIQSFLI